MNILFFILMSLTLLSLVGMLLSNNDKLNHFSYELYKSCLSGLAVYLIISFIKINEPATINVYKENTALEITYKNNVAIDSVVVVFKKVEE